ncbi:MAG: PAS domain S-box protein [Acidimicrobiales bacterium]
MDLVGDDGGWPLVEASPDGVIVVDHDGQVVFSNPAAGSLFAAPDQELVGRPVDDLLPDEHRSRHRAHRTRYRADPQVRLMGAGLELEARRLDGRDFFAEIALSPIELGGQRFTMASVRDISERVLVEDHFHRVVATMDASDDAMLIFDAETLRFSHVNEGAVRLLGYAADDLLTMTPVHLNPYTSEADYRELVGHLLDNPAESLRRQTQMLRSDGMEVPVEKTYRAAGVARDGTRWVVSLARDITDRLAAEAEIRESQDALVEARSHLALVEDRDRIARDLHDTVIQRLFAAGLGLQSLVATTDDRVKAKLEQTIDDLDETIRELRAAIFSLRVKDKVVIGLRNRLVDVVAEAGGAMRADPRISFEGPIDSLPPAIADHLVPTLREALSNIAKHAHADDVRVSLVVGDEVCLEVVDDGVGTTGDVAGGQGLANMAQRAEQLGGTATIAPGPDGGTRLTWVVPHGGN